MLFNFNIIYIYMLIQSRRFSQVNSVICNVICCVVDVFQSLRQIKFVSQNTTYSAWNKKGILFAHNSTVTLDLIPLASYSHRLILKLFNLNFLKLCIQLHIDLLIEIASENVQRTDPRLLIILSIFYKILTVNLVIFPAIICQVHINKVT